MKKRILPILLGGAVALSALFGLSACQRGGDENEPPPPGEVGEATEAGTVYNAPAAKDYTAAREDTRAALYSAFKPDGTKIGDYKALANAVNAAIENDAAAAENDTAYSFGSYVTQKEGGTKMFVNRKGYTSSNDECFWYYENGTSLDAFWCWDNTDTLGSLRNSKYITAHTQGYGTVASQTYNSYAVLDPNGQASDTLNAPSYELSTTLDAAVLAFPERFGGITKMEYTIDLSDVRITPAYTTGDEASKVYAFMGFYSWQDYYVLNIGIACDVSTGNWYAYEGSSRDDSASDTKYDIGDCIMTSTWNEAGYFEPDADSVTLTIETVVLEDDLGEYQVNDFTAAVKDGATYKRRISDELVNNYFSGYGLSRENSYVFVAGLDVKNEISSGVETVNTDYFNGAAFENLAVTSAKGYIPTEEEMSDVQYGYQIDADKRGQWHDMLLATGGRTLTGENAYDGPIDYTVLNNNLCSSYEAKDGADVYSFSYDMDASGSNALGSNAKQYQDVIDSLAAVTPENVGDYTDDIAQAEEWYGSDGTGTDSTLPAKYYNVLDFTHYLAAKEIQMTAVELTEAAKAVVDAFSKLGNLSDYTYLGWTAADDAIAGYMGSEIEAFRALKAAYDKLTAEEQASIGYHVSMVSFNQWADLSADLAAMESSENYGDAGITVYSADGKGTASVMTPADVPKVVAAELWKEGRTSVTWDADNDFLAGELYLVAKDYLEGLGMEMPALFAERFGALVTEGGCGIEKDYPALAAAVRLGSKWLAAMQDPLCVKPAVTEEDAALVNLYFVGSWDWTDTGISWAIKNAGGEWIVNSAVRLTNVVRYNMDPAYEGSLTWRNCLDAVIDVLEMHGYTPDTSSNVPFKVTESEVSAHEAEMLDVGSLSEEAQAFYAAWLEIGDIASYDIKGWTSEEADKTGYFWDAAQAAAGQKTAWEALSSEDKDAVAAFLSSDAATVTAQVSAWDTFVTEYEALLANEKFTGAATVTTITPRTGAEVTLTADQALQEIVYWSMRIKLGDNSQNGADKVWEGDASTSGVMNGDNSWYPSLFITTLVEYIEGIDESVALPSFLEGVFGAIGYDAYYDAYCALRQTVELAVAIETNGYTSLSDLTAEELEGLNTYWTSGYTVSSLLSWNWNSGNKFEMYMSARVARAVTVFGGTLMQEDGETPLKFAGYNDIVGKFLEANGYTLDTAKSGWGVTAAEIAVPAEEGGQQAE